LGPGLSEIISNFEEKVKDMNLDDEDLKVYLYSDRGVGCLYETITNVAPLNNLETAVTLEH
jgi:hypothetical protein